MGAQQSCPGMVPWAAGVTQSLLHPPRPFHLASQGSLHTAATASPACAARRSAGFFKAEESGIYYLFTKSV